MDSLRGIAYAKRHGIKLTLDQVKTLRDAYTTEWPEMKMYFDASSLCGEKHDPLC